MKSTEKNIERDRNKYKDITEKVRYMLRKRDPPWTCKDRSFLSSFSTSSTPSSVSNCFDQVIDGLKKVEILSLIRIGMFLLKI